MTKNYAIKFTLFLTLICYAIFHGACLKKSNSTNKTKQKFVPSNTDIANKRGSHASPITNPLDPLLSSRIPDNKPLFYAQDKTPIKEVDQYAKPSISGTKSNKQIDNQPVESSINLIKNNQAYSASNKEDPVSAAKSRLFITPEASSAPPQDVALTEEMLKPVNQELAHLSNRKIPIKIDHGDPQNIRISIDSVEFYTKDLIALLGLDGTGWLTDNVIIAYMKMIENRSKKDKKLPKVYIFDSLFYSALKSCSEDQYGTMKRWIKGDLSSYDKALIPIHLGNHWCLAVIDLPKNSEEMHTIEYYDSLGGQNKDFEEKLLDYFGHTMKGKEWTFQYKYKEGAKIQHDGSACGVFVCKFADYAARGAEIDFNQGDIPYFRKRIAIEILKGDLL